MYAFAVHRVIPVAPEIAWAVVADLEGYAAHAPNLEKTEIVSGQGEGLVRRCTDVRGATWTERCVLWDEGRRYAMEVDPDAYPYPMAAIKGTWSVEPQEGGTRVQVLFEYEPRNSLPVVGWLSDRLLTRPTLRSAAQELLNNWEAEMRRQPGSGE